MKYQTSDLKKKTAGYSPKICKMYLIPLGILKEIRTNDAGIYPWPVDVPTSSFVTKKIRSIELVADTLEVSETSKDSKAGEFKEIKITVQSNNLEPDQLLSLNSFAALPHQVLLYVNGRTKIYGEIDRGLDIAFDTVLSNEGIGLAKASIVITGQSRLAAPYTSLTP
ncbi:MAG: hypothetical protein BGO53_08895 [Sphingobacteriales bacterium 39-19]|nr:hypothetical protein [Sphingobacteriales bacterium]OJW09931.1 MAG: hypothetical protein BGO53_08895 [Sphingobacteriales bacterium 39-19]